MTSFVDLPNEILLMIWRTVDVQDIYSYSRTSKRVYCLVKSLLPHHFDLQRRLTTISNSGQEKPNHLSHILKEILVDPEGACYPLALKIQSPKVCWDGPQDDLTEPYTKSPEFDLNLFENAVKESDLIDQSGTDEWVSEIRSGNEEPLIALLLTLLPNIISLWLEDMFSNVHIYQVLNSIASRVPSNTLPLQRLCSVDIKATENFEDAEPTHLDGMSCFAKLPCIHTIRGSYIACDEDDLLSLQTPLPFSSTLKTLVLTDCEIHAKGLSDFILGIDGLESFTYISNDTDDSFDPFWIRSVLLAHHRFSLKSITLLSCGQRKSFMGRVDLFLQLEYLETDLTLLLGDLTETNHELSSVLPQSIKTLKLHVENPEDGLADWRILYDLRRWCRHHPELTKVTLHGKFAMDEEEERTQPALVAEFEAIGVQLSFESEARDMGLA